MTHVSQKRLTTKKTNLLEDNLVSIFKNLSPQGFSSISNVLFTKTEKLMFAKRLAIIILLSEGTSEGEIARSLKVTRQTIYRIGLELSKKPQKDVELLLKKIKRENIEKLIKSIPDTQIRGTKLIFHRKAK